MDIPTRFGSVIFPILYLHFSFTDLIILINLYNQTFSVLISGRICMWNGIRKYQNEPIDGNSSLNTYFTKRVLQNLLELFTLQILMFSYLWLYSMSLSTCIEQTDMKDYIICNKFWRKEGKNIQIVIQRESCLRSWNTRNSISWICFLIPEKFVSCISKRHMIFPLRH